MDSVFSNPPSLERIIYCQCRNQGSSSPQPMPHLQSALLADIQPAANLCTPLRPRDASKPAVPNNKCLLGNRRHLNKREQGQGLPPPNIRNRHYRNNLHRPQHTLTAKSYSESHSEEVEPEAAKCSALCIEGYERGLLRCAPYWHRTTEAWVGESGRRKTVSRGGCSIP